MISSRALTVRTAALSRVYILRGAVCYLHVLTLLSSLSVHVLTDCPLLLRPPLDMRIKAMFDAEEAAKREKAERFGSRGKKESSVSVFD